MNKLINTSERESTLHKSAFLNERFYVSHNNISELAKKRLKRWELFLGNDNQLLEECISNYNLSKTDFLKMLTNSKISPLLSEKNEGWQRIAFEVESRIHKNTALPKRINLNNTLFFNFIKPFLQVGYYHFKEKLNQMVKIEKMQLFEKEIEENLLVELTNKLASICTRTLVLELNVARVSGILEGETSEKRQSYFNEVLLNDPDYFNQLLSEYVVLNRLMSTKVDYWINNSVMLLQRFVKDYSLLNQEFNFGKGIGTLTSLKIGANVSDSHRKGQTVSILEFSSGVKVVYKPRSLMIDEKFNKLLLLINSWEMNTDLKGIKTINQGEYGWLEFIDHKGCDEKQEVSRFYYRIGSYLAVLYTLNAVDFHYENLIASGEYPYLVDLESLLHNNSRFYKKDSSAFSKAQRSLYTSVLNVGLLPKKILATKGKGIDLSGIGGQEGQILPVKSPVLDGKTTDEIKITRKNITIGANTHRPKIKSEYVNPLEYSKFIELGFEETYKVLQNHKDELVSILETWATIEVRQILRPTRRYGSLLMISVHPDFLRDGLERDMILDKLWLDTSIYPDLKDTFISEKQDMYQLDIPYFTTKPNEKHLWDSRGEKISNFFDTDALSTVLEHIKSLNTSDCKDQLQLIKTSMLFLEAPTTKKNKIIDLKKYNHEYPSKEFLNESIAIGEHLLNKMITGAQSNGQKDACWIGGGFVDNKEGEWRIAPVNRYLYDGISGIALFLAYLGYITKRSDFTDAAKKSIHSVLYNESPENNLGAFNGGGSLIYVYSHLHALWKENIYLEKAKEIANQLEPYIESDENIDLLSGVSGYAIILIQLFSYTRDRKYLGMIKKCGDRILQKAKVMNDGLGWYVPTASQPLSGFSHGTSGIAWALCLIAKVTGNPTYLETAKKALKFERGFYNPEHENWIDVREFNGKSNLEWGIMPVAWCHGAPGVLLSRLLLNSDIKDEEIDKEIETGLKTTLNYGFGRDHSLCHGDLGNLDILLFASQTLRNQNLNEEFKRYKDHVLQDIKERGWLSGLPKYNESPSLMVGLSGMGLGLLKIWSPDKVPSVLRLQAPYYL